jgi:nickel/cobalt transporter (NicO) family protein
MNSEGFLLILAVAGVGVLHTIVPDHWLPIALIARQRGWSKSETTRVAFKAGIGHVLSTLAIGLAVWLAGVAFATRFGNIVDRTASIALIGFGGWIAISALREMSLNRGPGHSHSQGHGHSHSHDFSHLVGGHDAVKDKVHGPELQRIETDRGDLELSIFEHGVPPRFRLTGPAAGFVRVETLREDGARHLFAMVNRGTYWESVAEIPEPHGFAVTVTLDRDGHLHTYTTEFVEHQHGHGQQGHDHEEGHSYDAKPANDSLYAPMHGGVAVLSHTHLHRHGSGSPHSHLHAHDRGSAHAVTAETGVAAPIHVHQHKTSSRTALTLVLGSSPMVEGVPAFFAAGKYGVGVIISMAIVFGISTIATYVLLCVYSAAGLQRVKLGSFERYGEVLSGASIALIGLVFWIWPVL